MLSNQIPTVLVVMPVYNAAKYLRKAMDSILSQSYTDYELLVVEDGSSDGSYDIIYEYVGSRMHLIHQDNRGPGAAMNRAIEYAQRHNIRYIARMDADDLSMPRRLEIQIGLLEEDSSAAACSSNCYYVDPETEQIIGTSTVPSRPSMVRWEIQNGLRGLVQGASCFRVDALVHVGGYRSQFRSAEEMDLFLRLAENFNLINSKEYLYKIRINNNSLSMHDVKRNLLYHFYALKCSENRGSGTPEPSFEKFVEDMDWKLSVRIWYEKLILKLWRTNMAKRNYFFLVLGSLLDPRRTIARILRRF